MKNIFVLSFIILNFNSLQAQVAQVPQVYRNGNTSTLYIRNSATSVGTSSSSLRVGSKIGVVEIVQNFSDPTFSSFIKVCKPSTTGTIEYGYIPSNYFYGKIDETNNYATVTTASLNIRTGPSTSNSNVTINGTNATFGNGSIIALTGNVSGQWYEVYLTLECSQATGWCSAGSSGSLLSINNNTQNYKVISGTVCNDINYCSNFLGNINVATLQFSNLGNTYSSGGYFQYKVPTNWSGTLTCTHASYNTSSPTSISVFASNHNYSNNFLMTNSVPCTPVSITSQPQSQSKAVGTTATFSVVASGTSPFTYQWRKNGTNISGATASSYTTPTLTLSDNGSTYSCYITNCSGGNNTTSNSATLAVTNSCTAVSITTQPQSQSKAIGTTATFSVVAGGTSPFTYQWRKNGTNISGATSSSYTTPTLTLSDNGSTYSCYITNCSGSKNVTSNSASLTVTNSCTAVSITTQPQSQSKAIGTTATFSVVAGGTSPFTYQWRKNGTNISGATSSSYTTPTLALSDNGSTYSCYITNCSGSKNVTSNSASLTVTNINTSGRISGKIYSQDINDASGITRNNIFQTTINLYVTGTSNILYTVYSSNGIFEFNNLPNGKYDVEVVQNYLGNIFKTKKTNITTNTNNLEIYLTSFSYTQLDKFVKELSNLECYLKDLGSISIESYNMQNINAYISGNKILLNIDKDVNERMLRLSMALRTMIEYYNLACDLGKEFVDVTDAMSMIFFSMCKMVICKKDNIILNNIMPDYYWEGFIESFKDNIIASLYFYKTENRNEIIAIIETMFDIIQNKFELGLWGVETTYDLFGKPKVQKYMINHFLENKYVKNTANYPNDYLENIRNSEFYRNLPNSQSEIITNLYYSTTKNADILGFIDGASDEQNLGLLITKYLSIANEIVCNQLPVLTITAWLGNSFQGGLFGHCIIKANKQRDDLIEESYNTARFSYLRVNSKNAEQHISSIDNRLLDTITKFNIKFNDLFGLVRTENYSEEFVTLYRQIIELNSTLNNMTTDEILKINASFPYSNLSDSIYFNSLRYALFNASYYRNTNIISLLHLYLDRDPILRDSLLANYVNVLYSNVEMYNELANISLQLNGIQSPGLLAINTSIPNFIKTNTSKNILISVKNYGMTDIDSSYLKLIVQEPLEFSVDSIYIGKINSLESKSVIITLSSNNVEDTTVEYRIEPYSRYARSVFKGGAITVTNNIISNVTNNSKTASSLLVYPNPNNGRFAIEYTSKVNENNILTIYNNIGQQVYSENLENKVGLNKHEIDIKNFPKGTYVVQIKSGENQATNKMIIE